MPNIGEFIIGQEISRGSNSVVYKALRSDEMFDVKFVAKCSIGNSNYISFNLQRHSYQLCNTIFDEDIVVPAVYGYYVDERIGEVLILERMDDIFDIDFIVNHEYYYSEIVVSKIAKAMAILHNHTISGYDIELYWNQKHNNLVILDIGPEYTFGVDTFYSLTKHWEIEKDNYMGLWNIESQILDATKAKEIFKTNTVKEQPLDSLMLSINPLSITMHIENVARVHALSIFAKFDARKRRQLLDIFVKEYGRNRDCSDINSQRYIEVLTDGVISNLSKAKAKLYYSVENVLSEESCSAEMVR